MAKKKVSPQVLGDLATLDLAKSILLNDVDGASAALEAGADPTAFWIDGRSSLHELAARKASLTLRKLLTPEVMKKVPSLQENRQFWSENFAKFVAMRGYGFDGQRLLKGGGLGAGIKGLDTAKGASRVIGNKWRLLQNATCFDRDDKTSGWHFEFMADWNGDHRIAGFFVSFRVDCTGWEIVELFNKAVLAGAVGDRLDPSDPLASRQKDWEGQNMVFDLIEKHYGMGRLLACLREGGNPFTTVCNRPFYEMHDDREIKAFMKELRTAIGPGPGWHLRIAPFLTEGGVHALREKIALKISTPKAKTKAKVEVPSLKGRQGVL